jgi:hypothetical protein
MIMGSMRCPGKFGCVCRGVRGLLQGSEVGYAGAVWCLQLIFCEPFLCLGLVVVDFGKRGGGQNRPAI